MIINATKSTELSSQHMRIKFLLRSWASYVVTIAIKHAQRIAAFQEVCYLSGSREDHKNGTLVASKAELACKPLWTSSIPSTDFHIPSPRDKCCNSDSRSPKGRSLPSRPQAQGRQADGRRRRRRGRTCMPGRRKHRNVFRIAIVRILCCIVTSRYRGSDRGMLAEFAHTQSMTGFIIMILATCWFFVSYFILNFARMLS